MARRAHQVAIELRTQEGRFLLRIRCFSLPRESGEFRLAAPAHALYKCSIRVAGEILKGRALPIFFTHEEQREERRKQHHRCGKFQLFEANQPSQSITQHAIAYLVVVLRTHHEPARRKGLRRIAVAAGAVQ